MTVKHKRSLGVCYYPEHWPQKMWAKDAARMKELGLTWVRIGEFSWSQVEPRPNQFEFDWLDEAIQTLFTVKQQAVSVYSYAINQLNQVKLLYAKMSIICFVLQFLSNFLKILKKYCPEWQTA